MILLSINSNNLLTIVYNEAVLVLLFLYLYGLVGLVMINLHTINTVLFHEQLLVPPA